MNNNEIATNDNGEALSIDEAIDAINVAVACGEQSVAMLIELAMTLEQDKENEEMR